MNPARPKTPPREPAQYLIFPPWASFSFEWRDLGAAFPKPDQYTRDHAELTFLRSIGYEVEVDDHDLFDCPFGGGIIRVTRPLARWFPAILLRKESAFRTPPGFGRRINYGIYVLAPRVTAEHELGLAEMPMAPCPLISVEQIDGDLGTIYFAYGFEHSGTLSHTRSEIALPRLGVRVNTCVNAPIVAAAALSPVVRKGLRYEWHVASYDPSADLRAVFSAVVYLGLAFASEGLAVVHAFSTSFLAGFDFPSAKRWSRSATPKQTAEDW